MQEKNSIVSQEELIMPCRNSATMLIEDREYRHLAKETGHGARKPVTDAANLSPKGI
jgi:hypothetical protein